MAKENRDLPPEDEVLRENFDDFQEASGPEELPSVDKFVPDRDFFPNAIDQDGNPVEVKICVLRIYPGSAR